MTCSFTIRQSVFETCPWYNVQACNLFISIALCNHIVWISHTTDLPVFSYRLIFTLFPVFCYCDMMNFLYMSPGSHVQVSLGLHLRVKLLGERACTSATLLDNNCFLQWPTNLYSHQLIENSCCTYLHLSFLPLLWVSIHQVLWCADLYS